MWVGRRAKADIYRQKAANLGYARDIYTLTRPILATAGPWDPSMLDSTWSFVEGRLWTATDSLVSNLSEVFDASLWLFVLVEFVSQVFVRGSDFGLRFVDRINRISPDLTTLFDAGHSDHINAARLIELHRLRGAVLQAEWTVIHAATGRFIANDLARTPVLSGDRRCYIIPLRADAVLQVAFGPGVQPMRLSVAEDQDKWVVGPILHEIATDALLTRVNALLAYSARAEIYGAPEQLIRELHGTMSAEPRPLGEAEPTFLAPFRDLGDTRQHEQLVNLVSRRPSETRTR